MLIHELSPKECAALLQRVRVGRLACASHDQPYVVPVQFSFDPDRGCLYSFATLGQKIRWMRANPLVCVESTRSLTRIIGKRWWHSGDPEPPVLYRIRIERMTGRRAARSVMASSDA